MKLDMRKLTFVREDLKRRFSRERPPKETWYYIPDNDYAALIVTEALLLGARLHNGNESISTQELIYKPLDKSVRILHVHDRTDSVVMFKAGAEYDRHHPHNDACKYKEGVWQLHIQAYRSLLELGLNAENYNY